MQQQAQGMGLDELAVTISHSKEYAVAFVSGDSK
jgi:phosphopantetheinyl transferase (holo-ACP synthase)